MTMRLLFLVGWLGAVCTAFGQADSFEFCTWTSTDGKKIEARLHRVDGKKITLQVKKGGKRYTFDKSKLSEASLKIVTDKKAELRKALTTPKSVDAATIYQAVALGMENEVTKALATHRLGFPVSKVRVQTDRISAYLVLGDALFYSYLAPEGRELFEKSDALWSRPKKKERIDVNKTVDKLSQKIASEDGRFTVHFTDTTVLEWGVQVSNQCAQS